MRKTAKLKSPQTFILEFQFLPPSSILLILPTSMNTKSLSLPSLPCPTFPPTHQPSPHLFSFHPLCSLSLPGSRGGERAWGGDCKYVMPCNNDTACHKPHTPVKRWVCDLYNGIPPQSLHLPRFPPPPPSPFPHKSYLHMHTQATDEVQTQQKLCFFKDVMT